MSQAARNLPGDTYHQFCPTGAQESVPSVGRPAIGNGLEDDSVEGTEPVREPASTVALAGIGNFLGTCIDERHPTLRGRVRVRVEGRGGAPRELWVPTLLHLPVRAGDRVVLAQLENAPEPVVIGVIDGFHSRPEPERRARALLELASDEHISIHGCDGAPLLDLYRGPDGPVVRISSKDVVVEVPGKLVWKAESISLEATRGRVTVEASDNVVVRGEIVELN